MNTFYPLSNIVHPTMLQAKAHADGTYTVSVSTVNHAPSHAYITLDDYRAHEDAGLIKILSVSEPNDFDYVVVNYMVF